MKSKLVIFDMGGVILLDSDVKPLIAEFLEISLEEFYEFAGENNLKKLYCGQINAEDFWKNFSKSYNKQIRENLWEKFYDPVINEEVMKLAKEAKEYHRVVVGTNTIESHYRINENKGYYEPFDRIYASNEMGVAKPDPAFYEVILDYEDREAAETVFIDDRKENLETANDMGVETIIFEGAESLGKIQKKLLP